MSSGQPTRSERVVRVDAPSRPYEVIVGASMPFSPRLCGAIRGAVPSARTAMLVTDAGLHAGVFVAHVMQALEAGGLRVVHDGSLSLEPGEQMKVLPTVERLAVAMAAARMERGDVAVVLGGGVLGDLVGFAAAIYRRGIAWINMPTTLLAMVDASVGGKTGANLSVRGDLKKNMVGAFWQPSLVVADVDALRTLPERHFRSGLAECIKHGMLSAGFGDADLSAWTRAHLRGRIAARDPDALIELVARNVAVKARVVGTDERELAPDADGGRALLNLGHTFGHAIETLPGLRLRGDGRGSGVASEGVQHGEAVGLGLIAASASAESAGLAPPGLTDRTRKDLADAGLPVLVEGLPTDADLLARMADDKKVASGVVRLVLPRGDGTCVVARGVSPATIAAGWTAIRT